MNKINEINNIDKIEIIKSIKYCQIKSCVHKANFLFNSICIKGESTIFFDCVLRKQKEDIKIKPVLTPCRDVLVFSTFEDTKTARALTPY